MDKFSHNRKHSIISNESKGTSHSSKARRSKSSKSSKETEGSETASTLRKMEQINEDDTTNYKESITDLFFNAFLDTIIVDRSEKHFDFNQSSSLVFAGIDSMESGESISGQIIAAASGTISNLSKLGRSSLNEKKSSANKYFHFTQSLPEGSIPSKEDGINTSCASICPCGWKIAFKNGNIYEGTTNGTLMHGKGVFYWSDGSIYRVRHSQRENLKPLDVWSIVAKIGSICIAHCSCMAGKVKCVVMWESYILFIAEGAYRIIEATSCTDVTSAWPRPPMTVTNVPIVPASEMYIRKNPITEENSIPTGDFKDGYPWGQGKLVLPDLSTYEGEFCMGFFHGHGTFNVKSTPLFYKGEWKYAERNGKGWLMYETNNWYEGDWANNKKHGSGYRQYLNGSRYIGEWLNDVINGDGCMFWSNNDYYSGEWSNGRQNGYGEYIWSVIAHDRFIFPNYNWYKGNWANGFRNGAGIMNFGHESGAKLAGTWELNRKNGPGLMVCGNGMVIQRNPLFKDDKPASFQSQDLGTVLASTQSSINDWKNHSSATQTFRRISEQIKTKENLNHLSAASVANITRSGINIKTKQYVKLLEKNTGNFAPLKIPIHNVLHEVDLSYFVFSFQREPLLSKDSDISAIEIRQMVNSKSLPMPSDINFITSSNETFTHVLERSASEHSIPNVNELKNLIINYMPQLRNIYKKYASLCAKEEKLTFEPVLVRLFLWQLYRDIGVTDKEGVSIVEIDEMLVNNPKSCLETAHNPWEPIYFWQFLQALVGVASLLYAYIHKMDYTPISGFMYHMFKGFLEYRLFPNAGKFEGNCLTHLKDLVPISSVYRLYKEVGEPHTIEEFLKNTCLKKGQGIPCYKTINSENIEEYHVQTGTNIVILNNEVLFAESSRITVKYESDNRYEKQSLYTFTHLGRKRIIKCLAKICPQIITETGRTVLHYRLSFIEFYEAILLLAFEKVEQERSKFLEESKCGLRESKTFSREPSKMSQHFGKKKKSKK